VPLPPAAWSLAVRRRSVDTDGTAHLVADLLDAGRLQLTLDVRVSAAREVTVLVRAEPGATLAGFQAWSTV
jgi:hypothetical protein